MSVIQYPSMIKLSGFAWSPSFKTNSCNLQTPESWTNPLSWVTRTVVVLDVTVSFDVAYWPCVFISCRGSKRSFSLPHLCCAAEMWVLPHPCHPKWSHLARQKNRYVKY